MNRTDMHSYWSITIKIGLFGQTACQSESVQTQWHDNNLGY
jgi:hypothetical protein